MNTDYCKVTDDECSTPSLTEARYVLIDVLSYLTLHPNALNALNGRLKSYGYQENQAGAETLTAYTIQEVRRAFKRIEDELSRERKVIIEVTGGVVDVVEASDDVEITIIDHDLEEVGLLRLLR